MACGHVGDVSHGYALRRDGSIYVLSLIERSSVEASWSMYDTYGLPLDRIPP